MRIFVISAQPKLITSGAYALIGHPIYTGPILAMLGSAIAVSIVWALVLRGFFPILALAK